MTEGEKRIIAMLHIIATGIEVQTTLSIPELYDYQRAEAIQNFQTWQDARRAAHEEFLESLKTVRQVGHG